MNTAVKQTRYELAHSLLTAIRTQMERLIYHGLQPGAVLMSGGDYLTMQALVENEKLCHNKDTNTVNGIPIVIQDVSEPIVTPTPSSLWNAGLL